MITTESQKMNKAIDIMKKLKVDRIHLVSLREGFAYTEKNHSKLNEKALELESQFGVTVYAVVEEQESNVYDFLYVCNDDCYWDMVYEENKTFCLSAFIWDSNTEEIKIGHAYVKNFDGGLVSARKKSSRR